MPRGTRQHPVQGIEGAKPRTTERRRLRKMPTLPDAVELEALSKKYLEERNRAMKLKRQREEIGLATTRGELIEKSLAIRQLTYCVIAARQRLLAIPSKIGSHFGDREVAVREMVDYLRGEIHAALTELAKMPEAVEPGWQERLEDEEWKEPTTPTTEKLTSSRQKKPGK
jgi:hypothetical protein